ncbi:hypothetical protein BKA83DRAFT_4343745 [Pisolithus microcarpus]|nr:hypothetical protein BKA83DRAFT_4343745 [Pisolithus microcarpus]
MQSLLLFRTILFHPGLRLSQRCKRSHMNFHPPLVPDSSKSSNDAKFDGPTDHHLLYGVVTNVVPQSTGVGTGARLLPLHVPSLPPSSYM